MSRKTAHPKSAIQVLFSVSVTRTLKTAPSCRLTAARLVRILIAETLILHKNQGGSIEIVVP